MMVSAGFTAQLEGEEAPVDDVEVVDVVGLAVVPHRVAPVSRGDVEVTETPRLLAVPTRSASPTTAVMSVETPLTVPLLCRRRAGGPDVRTVLMRMVAAGLRAGSSGTRPDVKRPVSLAVVRANGTCRQSGARRRRAPTVRTAARLNVHFHALGLDGLFAPGADGTLRFHRLPPPSAADVAG